MAGPCSYPAQDREEFLFLQGKVCTKHKHCVGKDENCVFITWREWFLQRNKLHTGKTRA